MGDATNEGRSRFGLSRRAITVLVTFVVVLLGAVLVVRLFDERAVVSLVRGADPWWLAGAVAIYSLSWPLRGRRYDDLLGAMGRRCGSDFLTATVFLSQTANLVVPARAGDGYRAHLLKTHRSVPYTIGAASLVAERLFDLLTVLFVGTVALVLLAVFGSPVHRDIVSVRHLWAVLAIIAIIATIGVLAAVGPRLLPVVDDALRWSPARRLTVHARRFGRALGRVLDHPPTFLAVSITSVAIWLLDVGAAIAVLVSIGVDRPSSVLLLGGTLAVVGGNLAKVVPLTQGGIGVYEASFAAVLLATVGVSPELAIAVAIIDHGLKNAVTVIGGGVSGLWLHMRTSPGRVDPTDF